MSEENETRAEQRARLKKEIERREQRLRRLRVEEIRSGDGLTVEEFEAMSPEERRQLKGDDPEMYDALQSEKRRRGEQALGVPRGPLKTRSRR